jgi:hypothetical protein
MRDIQIVPYQHGDHEFIAIRVQTRDVSDRKSRQRNRALDGQPFRHDPGYANQQ